ncbi:MAG TPA: hypothetical protein DDW50_16210 [Firmicutes bacterium]|nr:hypothetical protein [Bacillota bacterium]
MTKRLLILFLTGCLTLFVGYQTFAMDTVQTGGNPAISSAIANSNADVNVSPAASLDSSTDKTISGHYYHHSRDHYHRHYWGPGSGGVMLFMLVTMMIILIALA